jgi:hypothetical protein
MVVITGIDLTSASASNVVSCTFISGGLESTWFYTNDLNLDNPLVSTVRQVPMLPNDSMRIVNSSTTNIGFTVWGTWYPMYYSLPAATLIRPDGS